MTDERDWHDPFAEDEAARERERRRAEREARRRGSRESLGGEGSTGHRAGSRDDPGRGHAPERRAPSTSNPPPSPSPRPRRRRAATTSNEQPATATAPNRAASGERPSGGPDSLRARRIIGGIVFLVLLAALVFGVVKVVGKLTESDPAPVEASKPAPKTRRPADRRRADA